MMECWNHGFNGILSNQNGFSYFLPIIPFFQYSIIPADMNTEIN
jgi:hypothetical protein